MKEIFNQLRKYLFYLRKGGIKEFLRFHELNKFEKNIFGKKKLIWNNLGFWQVDPMPTEKELEKFYSEIYWLNNKYYKNILLIPRDLSHYLFIKKKIQNIHEKLNFMNFGAGHGGISYLMALKNLNIINIEPSLIPNFEYENFHSFKNLEEFLIEIENFNKIDIIYSSHTVEHLRDPINFFKKISKILNNNGFIFLEVPNCRKSQIDNSYQEGGCDGKITGSHLIYFTKDFFENFSSEISFFKEEENGQKYVEVKTEDEADCIRVIISAEKIKNWVSKLN